MMRTEGKATLSRSLDESRVANDLADFARGRLHESPGTAVTVGEGDVNVLTALDSDGVVLVVENLASEILPLDIGTDVQLDDVEGTAGTNRILDFALKAGLVEGSLRGEIAIRQSDADIRVLVLVFSLTGGHSVLGVVDGAGFALLEGWVADDLADLSGSVLEGPLALVAICEGDVGVLAADNDNGAVVHVKDLAAKVFLLGIRTQTEFDGLEGAGGANGRLGLALALGELGLGADLQVLVLEDDGDGAAKAATGARPRSSERPGSGKGRKEDGRVLHYEG